MVTLCVYVPVNILISFIPGGLFIQEYGTGGIQIYFSILNLMWFFMWPIATLGIIMIVEKAMQGTSYTWREALHYSLSKWTTVIATDLLGSAILLGLHLLFILPGVIWTIYYVFWIYVVALRNLGGKKALDYSRNLVEGQWWRVFGISFVLWIISFVAVGLIATIAILLNVIFRNPVFGILTGSIGAIVDSYFVVVATVFFLNTDNRRKSVHQLAMNTRAR